MPISAKFYLIVNPSRFNTIVSILKGLGFKVSQGKQIGPQDSSSVTTTDIVCTMTIKNSEITGALNLAHTVGEIEGVVKTVPMYGTEEEKLHWYKKPIIAISISSSITFFTVYEAVRSSSPIDILNILAIAGIPTVVTFFSQILYRYFSHESTLWIIPLLLLYYLILIDKLIAFYGYNNGMNNNINYNDNDHTKNINN